MHVLRFELVVGFKLSQLILNIFRVDRLATQSAQRLCSIFEVATLDIPLQIVSKRCCSKVLCTYPWRFRQKEEASTEDQCPSKLNSDWDAVGAGVHAVHCGVVDYSSEKETNGDTELVAGHNGATDSFGSNLAHVQNDNGTDEPDTDTCNQAPGNQKGHNSGGYLEYNTDDKDAAARDDGHAAPDPVSKRSGEERTEKGTSGQNRNDERLLPSLIEASVVRICRSGGTCNFSCVSLGCNAHSLPNCSLKAFMAKTPLM